MSQPDYCNTKTVPVEFIIKEELIPLPKAERLTLTLITDGTVILKLNDITVPLSAPCILLSSPYDKMMLLESSQTTAKSLHFHPTFINKSLTFESLMNSDYKEIADEHDFNLLKPFLIRNDLYNGTVKPLTQTYLCISKWFDSANKEYTIKNGRHSLHHVRRYLLQILLLLEENYFTGSNIFSDESLINIVLEYIHANFSNDISLDALCKLVYVNRTTLARKFKAHTRRTPIDYLLHYRLSIACDLLTHSSLSIRKIAETTGFKYENYFTRQFAAKIGMTPTQYRQSDSFETLNIKESRIVDEF